MDAPQATPALLMKGFRPFFLLAAAFGAVVVPLWMVVFTGGFAPAGPLAHLAWHGHEMIHGFTVAVLAGFLLTAVGNWTGRETAVGAPLAGLALLWIAGRIALLAVPGWPASLLDLAFLPALIVAIARPLIASRNSRNAAFPVLLAALWATSLAAHLDALDVCPGAALPANRIAVHLVAVIIVVVAGRIVPMFTRNATGAPGIGNVRALDRTATLATGAVAALQVAPDLARPVAAIAGLAVVGRTWRWGLLPALRHPLLWVLHAGHLAVGAGLLLEAVPAVPPTLALHAITVGGIGVLTLGMMARVALGHSGRPLRVGPLVTAAFVALLLATCARVLGPLALPAASLRWLWIAAWLWSAGFAVYFFSYLRILTGPRADGRPG